ncbi:hypothetical protein Tco_0363241 [Tanacetum coccineum]
MSMTGLQISDLPQDILVGPAYKILKGTCRSYVELKYNMEELTNVKVNIWYGYGYLKEIEVRRFDQQLYKFMEGDFPRLHLNDIEDMMLLVVRNRLFNLKGEAIIHRAAALQALTLLRTLQTQMAVLQSQQRPAREPARPEIPEEASSSS